MDKIVWFCAGSAIVMAAIDVLYGPFLIGKTGLQFTAINYLIALVKSAVLIVLAGRAVGWW